MTSRRSASSSTLALGSGNLRRKRMASSFCPADGSRSTLAKATVDAGSTDSGCAPPPLTAGTRRRHRRPPPRSRAGRRRGRRCGRAPVAAGWRRLGRPARPAPAAGWVEQAVGSSGLVSPDWPDWLGRLSLLGRLERLVAHDPDPPSAIFRRAVCGRTDARRLRTKYRKGPAHPEGRTGPIPTNRYVGQLPGEA